jgi:hypothetical protein
MPLSKLHLTALEITHSLTAPQIQSILSNLGPTTIEKMTDYTFSHRARLIKPMLSYDGAAVALSFLPAAGENLPTNDGGEGEKGGRSKDDDNFTYHHLRRDLFNVAKETGVSIDSRYVVPSSHTTIARFLTQEDHDSSEKMKVFVEKIEGINRWLQDEYWEGGKGKVKEGEWIVGSEKGLDCREGALWYGGGVTVRIGRGF